MKKYAHYLGIDVSKKTLDVCLIDETAKVIMYKQVGNTRLRIKELYKLALKKRALICFEDTGIYSNPLCFNLSEENYDYWKVPDIEIKRAKGISRGKNDKTDSKDISLYSLRHLDKLQLTKLDSTEIQQLKLIQTERNKVIKAIKLFKTTLENEKFMSKEVYKEIKFCNAKTLSHLKKTLDILDLRSKEIIAGHQELKQQFDLLISVPGVGKTTALNMIMTTNCFVKFDNWRKLACYAGIAPFEYSSGTSVRGRTKVNHFADKNLKSILHMASLSAMRYDPQLKNYFEKKKEEKHTLLIS